MESLLKKMNLKKIFVLNELTIVIFLVVTILLIVYVVNRSQKNVETEASEFISKLSDSSTLKRYELAKLKAEVDQIRSDTSGSLFWLKLIALFVTVGGAVGGYLAAQSKATKDRINFEHRKDVDAAYQTIVQELSDNEQPILRAAAAVKLGAILQNFPSEWKVSEERKSQLIQLTKQVLAAALSIEKDEKILKIISIALVLHRSLEKEVNGKKVYFADVRELDLSSAEARNAYWAKSDFSYADFFSADLSKTSFRSSVLNGAQFKDANLTDAVLIEALCHNANFDGAKVNGMNLQGADLTGVNTDIFVDVSRDAKNANMIRFGEWLRQNGFAEKTL